MNFSKFFENNQTNNLHDLKRKLKKLLAERDYARSKEEGGSEHVDLTNKINKIRDKIKQINRK